MTYKHHDHMRLFGHVCNAADIAAELLAWTKETRALKGFSNYVKNNLECLFEGKKTNLLGVNLTEIAI